MCARAWGGCCSGIIINRRRDDAEQARAVKAHTCASDGSHATSQMQDAAGGGSRAALAHRVDGSSYVAGVASSHVTKTCSVTLSCHTCLRWSALHVACGDYCMLQPSATRRLHVACDSSRLMKTLRVAVSCQAKMPRDSHARVWQMTCPKLTARRERRRRRRQRHTAAVQLHGRPDTRRPRGIQRRHAAWPRTTPSAVPAAAERSTRENFFVVPYLLLKLVGPNCEATRRAALQRVPSVACCTCAAWRTAPFVGCILSAARRMLSVLCCTLHVVRCVLCAALCAALSIAPRDGPASPSPCRRPRRCPSRRTAER